MTTRRSNGEGSVFYRSHRDKWVAAIFDPLAGKTMTRSARTKADANRLLWEMRNRIDDGAPAADSPLTLERWCATWLETRVGKRRSPGTVNQYANRMRRYVLPYLGRRRMDQIPAPMIEDTRDQLAARGLSYSTIKNAHNALSACLHDAVRENRLGVNPTQRASLATNAAPAKRPAPPSLSEVHDLITTALDTDPPVGRLEQLVASYGLPTRGSVCSEMVRHRPRRGNVAGQPHPDPQRTRPGHHRGHDEDETATRHTPGPRSRGITTQAAHLRRGTTAAGVPVGRPRPGIPQHRRQVARRVQHPKAPETGHRA